MQLEKLTLRDVGTFGGKQTFDLAPRIRYGAKRPIILFGGLNGTGKTTFLTAIRLALYGRHSIESGTTQKQYDEFLRDLIHRPSNSLIKTTAASIALEFTYARLGEKVRYRVVRTWQTLPQAVDEQLRIFKNDDLQEALQGEQAQSFLNQLIPSGISQFFFFDGEKIAALARDDSDSVLADAIRRLLGLDLADRLNSDLTVFLRQRQSNDVDNKAKKEIQSVETQIESLEEQISTGMAKLEAEVTPALRQSKEEYERRRVQLMDRGGAWAVNRSGLEQQLDKLREERKALEEKLREQLNGLAIFTLASKLNAEVLDALQASQAQIEKRTVAKAIEVQAVQLKNRIATLEKLKGNARAIESCIDEWVRSLQVELSTNAPSFGFSDTDTRTVISALSVDAPLAQRDLASVYGLAQRMAGEEELIQDRLAHAPSEDSLKEAFDALTNAAEDVAKLEAERRLLVEEIRRLSWMSVDLIRRLRKLILAGQEGESQTRGVRIAESLQIVISEFKNAAAEQKCKKLEHHFVAAFTRLARKDDIVSGARINPADFSVVLLDRTGQEIPKKRLSAGEKQIYAIAMLEALAKTSGRNLPIIIDTPLGRLDSKHREKLVQSYFPVASHQVIILSTDTEVELTFYKGLQPYLSHGYHLIFDPSEKVTTAEEGYFWKFVTEEDRQNAA